MEDSTKRETANKRLHVNHKVSSAVEDYVEGPTKYQCLQRLYGYCISATGGQKYIARFDEALLRAEMMHMSLPPEIQIPIDDNLMHIALLQELEEDMVVQEEVEPLGASPDDAEIKHVLEEATQEGGGAAFNEGFHGNKKTEYALNS
jgi:hypothetical protein